MNMKLSELRSQTLLLDLETTRTGKIRHVGAISNGRIFEKFTRGGSKTVLEELNEFAEDSHFVLGHNLLGHDFPLLKTFAPWLELLEKPFIDTLYLSPIAFPQNPYHRLVKDYKLVRSSISSPVEDAKIAASVFEDQWHGFAAISEKNSELIDFYRFCFQDSFFNGFPGIGLSVVFSAFVPTIIGTADDAFIFFDK
jgi:ATP-dependent DNA helicase RecQ